MTEVKDIFECPFLTPEQRQNVVAVEKKVKVYSEQSGWHSIAYVEWTPRSTPFNRTAFLVHALTRNSRDWDALAQYLVATLQYRCVAVDVPGRGNSDWMPSGEYGVHRYPALLASVINSLAVQEFDYIGTSLGGLCGMYLALKGTPIRRCVFNDVGPIVPQAALKAIASYVGIEQKFATFEEAEKYFKALYGHAAAFGANDAEIKHIATHSVRKNADGTLRLHYDLAIRDVFASGALVGDMNLFPVWEALSPDVPLLLIRGANSTLLTEPILEKMLATGSAPKKSLIIPGCGHAPTLMSLAQVEPIGAFLNE